MAAPTEAVCDGLDDAHHSAAIGTGGHGGDELLVCVIGRRRDRRRRRLSIAIPEQRAAQRELGRSMAVGEESEMANAMEAVR
jgi:hypothetical protein